MRIVVVCLLAVAGAFAQNATLSGLIKDSSGAAVPQAAIVVTSDEMGIKHNLKSNESGYYSLPALLPGTYRIAVEASGFQTTVRENMKLEVGQNANLDIQLEVGRVEQTVQVEAAPAMVNTVDGSVSTVIDRDFVANMPLNGRSFNSLLELAPGAIMVPTTESSRGTYAVNGQRSDSNYYTVDGVSANLGVGSSAGLGQGGGGASVGTSALGGTNNLVSIDALQEFRISTSTYAPEYGRGPGGQIAVVTRSGNNQYHGALFEYLRNDKLDANDWFANRSGLKRAAERQNDFGGVLGGPVVKDRTFFFFSYEGLRLEQPATLIADVPSLDFRQEAPAKLQPYLNAFPLPTGPDEIDPKTHLLNGYAPFTATASDPSNLNATSLRVDHMLKSGIQLFARYNYAPSASNTRGSLGAVSTVTAFDSGLQTATAGAVVVLSPTITNDFRINFSLASGYRHFVNDTFGGGTPLPDSAMFPAGYSSSNAAFEFKINTGTLTAFLAGDLAQNTTKQYNVVDSVNIVRGTHQLKFGIDWRRVDTKTNSFNLENFDTFNDTGTISPVAGTVLSGLGSVSLNTTVDGDMIFINFSAYAQDTWKLHSRLTLTYGLRWEVNPPPGLAKGSLFAVTQITDPSNLALAASGTPLYKGQWGKFAPRIGLAYQLSRTPRWMTVLRGGFGMFYDTAFGRQATLLASPPLTNSSALSNVALPLATVTVPLAVTTLPFTNFVALDPHLDLPVTYQWNFAVDQALGGSQNLGVTYVGSAGRNLFVGEQYANLNNNFQGGTILGTNDSSSDYNSLQVQYQRRFARGLQVLLSYDWSHSIDTASNDTVNVTHGSDFYPTQNRGDSDFDVRQSFTAAVVYQVPVSRFGGRVGRAILGGWSVDPLVRARTALPVDITNSRTIGKVSAMTRVNLVYGQPLYIEDPTVPDGRRFNPLAFSIPTGFVQGTFGRNVMRGFDLNQTDLAVNRNFKLYERMKLQFRGEFFNVLNHPNFANPNGAYSSSATFGVATTMLNKGLNSASGGGFNALYQNGGPRSIQLSMKLTF